MSAPAAAGLPLCDSGNSVLLLVDVQVRLAAAMPEEARSVVLRNAGILAQAAGRLGVPTLVSEQYPKGLGETEPALAQHLNGRSTRIEKTCFSCCDADGFLDTLRATNRKQVDPGRDGGPCLRLADRQGARCRGI